MGLKEKPQWSDFKLHAEGTLMKLDMVKFEEVCDGVSAAFNHFSTLASAVAVSEKWDDAGHLVQKGKLTRYEHKLVSLYVNMSNTHPLTLTNVRTTTKDTLAAMQRDSFTGKDLPKILAERTQQALRLKAPT